MATLNDYEPLTSPVGRPRESAPVDETCVEDDGAAERSEPQTSTQGLAEVRARLKTFGRGHALTYAGFFLFTVLVYFRPYELIAALSKFQTMTFWVAIATLCLFVPIQLSLENNLTARPPEVKYLFLLCLMAVLSIPLAIDPLTAWESFYSGFLKYALMFVVMVNVVRTERRLRWLLMLALALTVLLSANALDDYRLGNLTIEGYRVKGIIGSMLENPNDLAIHLVTMMPLALALGISSRGILKKTLYGLTSLLILGAVVVTYSRAGFLGMAAAALVLAWKLGRRNRVLVFAALGAGMIIFLALAPGNYLLRLASMFDSSLDPVGSSTARQTVLWRSIHVALRHPLLGIGIGNFPLVSLRNLVSHNAYTQVASEMGLIALYFYIRFITVPIKRLLMIERATKSATQRATQGAAQRASRDYYLAVGLQASLVGYMVSSFFGSVAFYWFIYYLVGYAVCMRRLYEAAHGPLEAVEPTDAEGKRRRRGRTLAAWRAEEATTS